MISGQIKPNQVNDPKVIDAFAAIPKEAFVPKNRREVAYVDEDIEVAHGRFIIAPMVLARLVSLAAIRPDDVVLDVACGTGYSTAVLSRLAGVVVGIEDDPGLVELATEALGNLEIDNAAVIDRNLTKGCPGQGPFNVIMIAGGVEEIPETLKAQLVDGGRLVTVKVDRGVGRGFVLTRSGNKFGGREVFDAQVPVLPGFRRKKTFEFPGK